MSKQEELEQQKAELINDLMAVATIMEDYYRFHPANPKQENVVEEYRKLESLKEKIELDLKKLNA
jgi:hypothetical protein